jgi:hypothetical protein
MSMTLVGSHAAAMVFVGIATAIMASAYIGKPHPRTDYFVAICAKTFHLASTVEASYLADNVSAPSGDVDRDVVAMAVPLHQRAIEMGHLLSKTNRIAALLRGEQGVVI